MDENVFLNKPNGDESEFYKQVAGLLTAARQNANWTAQSSLLILWSDV